MSIFDLTQGLHGCFCDSSCGFLLPTFRLFTECIFIFLSKLGDLLRALRFVIFICLMKHCALDCSLLKVPITSLLCSYHYHNLGDNYFSLTKLFLKSQPVFFNCFVVFAKICLFYHYIFYHLPKSSE